MKFLVGSLKTILAAIVPESCVIVRPEARFGRPSKGEDFEKMARRRFQDPKPVRRGHWWTLLLWRDHFVGAECVRKRERVRLAPATMPEREVLKIAAEHLRPLNQGLEAIGSATNFAHYVEQTYMPVVMPLMAKSTRDRSTGVLNNYLLPTFEKVCLRDLTTLSIQRYFSNMAASVLSHESRDKIRDVLSSVLRSAVEYGMLVKNPVENVRMPAERRGKKRNKPYLTPRQFDVLVGSIAEPYATMVYVAIYTGLRVSELAGLKWNDVHVCDEVDAEDEKRVRYSVSIDERYCRGDWGAPKSEASNATIGVNMCVYHRIQTLRLLTVAVRAGNAVRRYKVVNRTIPMIWCFNP